MIYLSPKWSKVEPGSLLSEPEWGVLALLVLVARKFGCNGTLLVRTASDGTLEHCEMKHCLHSLRWSTLTLLAL